MQALKARCLQLSKDTLSGRRRAKKCWQVFVLTKCSETFTPRLVNFQRSQTIPGLSPSLHRAPRNPAVAFAISLGHFKGHLSRYQNGAATDEDGQRSRHGRGGALAFYRVCVISGRDESDKFVSDIRAERGESAIRSERTTRTRTPWRYLRSLALLSPPLYPSPLASCLSRFILLCST